MTAEPAVRDAAGPPAGPQLALIDLLDRLLDGGVVLTGDLVLCIADVDLVHISLRAVIRSVEEALPSLWEEVPR
ncbi:gas vesicle protein GvpJ [Peterkaempfera griseoplana]|uniref:gas vesicle protein GvpJ n=1 Tax=Peterkaempfera griseoplana TaxID=66896 RepID=UPI0006E3C786|nr:gas vesicle protein GvpJ [Peterkaempfera griseoplana]